MVADELADSGLTRLEAERIARMNCGGRTQLEQTVRDLRTGIQVVVLWQETRIAVRQLIKQPLFTVAAVASLALGMGATTAIFTAVYSLTLRPLPYSHADQLVFVSQGIGGGKNSIFAPDFMAMRSGGMHSIQQPAGFAERPDATLTGGSIPERLRCVGITANFLDTLDVHPQLGRDLLEADDRENASPVVLITDRLWQSHFGADRRVVGSTITLDGKQRTVIGVLPRGFEFPEPSIEPDIVLPANLPTAADFAGGPVAPVNVIARMRDGVTRAQTTAEIRTFFARRTQFYPSGWAKPDVSVDSLQEHVAGNFRKPLLLLLGCIVCVLMVVCANVGNLQLARAASRQHELSIRRALGATRCRLVQHFLIENLLLMCAASLLGLAVAWGSLTLLRDLGLLSGRAIESAYGAPTFGGLFGKYGSTIHISPAVVSFAFVLPLLSTVIFGIVPALRATDAAALPQLQSEGRQTTAGGARRRFGHVLLAFEVACSIALLSCAGLLIRSLANIMSFESGFDPGNTMTANVRLTGARYQRAEDMDHFTSELLSRLEAIHGVQAATIANLLPVENTARIQFSLTNEHNPPFDPGHLVAFITISPNYFGTMRTTLLQGRALSSLDSRISSRVMVVNRDLAKRFFGGNALGKQLYIHDLGSAGSHLVPTSIVGVVENVPHNGFLQPIEPEVYLPLAQAPQPDFEIAIRHAGDPALLRSSIVKAVAETDSTIPVTGIETMDDRIAYRVTFRKALLVLISTFATLAVIVSAIGIAGMFAYMVAQRTREMGIRLALGASRVHLLRIVLKETWAILNLGTTLGLLISFASSHAIGSMLVGIGRHDPVVNVSALALTSAVAFFAALAPAIRASRTDVLAVLREDSRICF